MSEPRPAPRKLTREDHAQLPDDGRRHEILDGEHVVSPAPVPRHQRISRRIQFQLYEQVELAGRGEVFNAPCDVQLSEHDVVQPDLFVVLAGREVAGDAPFEGSPDLVVEILSPSTAGRDRGVKLHVHERAGVPEHWVVDPGARVVERHVLEDGRFRLVSAHRDRVELGALTGVAVDLTRVW